MRFINSLLLYALSIASSFATEDNSDIRQKLFALNFDSRQAISLLDELEEIEPHSTLIQAYKGACKAHIAKITKNPFKKVGYLQAASNDLEQAISADGANLELRFLRYAMQIQIPRILGLSHELSEDRSLILNNLDHYNWELIDPEIRRYICNFFIEKGDCSVEEVNKLSAVLK